ncbi:neuropeptide FF receptor 1-like [Oncorhynchus nerka]|uniref:neuropeptide FF receptor 1-like n=1 Tax=Oncorhynchus nerka TaxID=8023 RepID=UPI0011308B9E|nr:neuropeptide FF receptor 1-like [Oncorhynchus nerka]
MEIASLNETAVNSNTHGVAMDSGTMHSVAMDSANRTYMPYYLHSTGMAISYILCYVVVLLLCVGGNVLVSLVVLRNRNMRSVTNLFILNLAISDLLIGVFCVPTTLIDSLISGWPFGQITCTMSNLVQGMSVSASVFTLVAIAVDRFTGIVYPFRHRIRPVTALLTILFIWVLAFAVICPSAANLTVIQLEDTYMLQDNQTYPVFVCFENWPRPEMRRVYTMVIFVHVYLAPLGIISIMYGCIAAKLSINLRQVRLAKVRRARSQRRVKVIKMLTMVAVLFMVSWLPLWTLMLLTDYRDLDTQQIDFLSSYLFPVAHWLAFFNSGINPIIYGFFNENFRRGFQAAVACRPCSQSITTVVVNTRFNFPPPNRVFNDNPESSGGKKGHCSKGTPKIIPHGTHGIVLDDRNVAPNRVIGAWVE